MFDVTYKGVYMTQKTKRVDNKGRKLPDGYSQRKDGRYQARFTYSGKRHTLYDTNLSNLKIKVDDMKSSLNKGMYSDKGNISLNQWFLTWMEIYKINLKNETKINYHKYWNWYVGETIGKIKIKDIRRSDILKLYNSLILGEKKLSTGTIKYINNLVNSCLCKAIDEEIIYKNPASTILKEVVQTTARSKTALSLEQQNQLIKYVRNSNFYSRFEPMLIVLFGTGIRVGELCALTWDCVDLQSGIITINKTLKYLRAKTDEGLFYDINSAKTKASEREIPMIDEVREALLEHMENQKAMGYKSNIAVRGYTDFVFTTRERKPMYPDYINLELKRIISTHNNHVSERSNEEGEVALLLPMFSPHTTRHSFASRCYEADVQAKTTQLVLGHRNIKTTLDIYTHCSADKLKKDISQLSNAKIFG